VIVSTTTTHQDSETVTPPECVGPMAIPSALTHALRRLAEAAAVDDLVPLSVCATELIRRLSPPGLLIRARVIRGPLEAVTPLSTPCYDTAVSFRDALQQSPDRRMSTVPMLERRFLAVPVDVVFLVSPDGDRLYVESLTTSAHVPTAEHWAGAFLRLLSSAGSEPDEPLAGHALPDRRDDGGRDRERH
jgi:hypothetical protein